MWENSLTFVKTLWISSVPNSNIQNFASTSCKWMNALMNGPQWTNHPSSIQELNSSKCMLAHVSPKIFLKINWTFHKSTHLQKLIHNLSKCEPKLLQSGELDSLLGHCLRGSFSADSHSAIVLVTILGEVQIRGRFILN